MEALIPGFENFYDNPNKVVSSVNGKKFTTDFNESKIILAVGNGGTWLCVTTEPQILQD